MQSKHSSIAEIVALIVPILLVGCRMPLSMSITVTSPQNETITFNQVDDIAVAPSSVLQVTIREGFDSYEWMLDGEILNGQTSAIVTIDCAPIELGVHQLAAFVEKNGQLYSKTLRFRIEN
jgi:hypothetical protein